MALQYIAAGASIAGGLIGAAGARNSGNAAYRQGQIEYHAELQKSHYNAKILQRKMIEQLHTQMAQWGGAGVSVGVGSPVTNMMKTLNDLQEDKVQIIRDGRTQAWKYWAAGSDKYVASRYQATGSLLSGIAGAAGAMKE